MSTTRLYDELEALEKETGTVLAGSPTITVGYEAVDELPKERHERPMLSLGKTKSREELRGLVGKPKRASFLEAGWADRGAYLSGRNAVQGGHSGKTGRSER